jgi:hypothetical protein
VRYLWMTSFAILAAGAALLAGAIFGALGPIALVCGLLLVWTGVVKIVVLRIWKRSLASPGSSHRADGAETLSRSPG